MEPRKVRLQCLFQTYGKTGIPSDEEPRSPITRRLREIIRTGRPKK